MSTASLFPTSSPATEFDTSSVVVHFHVVDYVILVLVLLLSLGIGMYFAFFGGKQKTTREYFKGDSKMPIFPVILSIMASFLSSNGMLGVPAEVYLNGFNYWFCNTGSVIGIPLACYCFLPVFYDLKITSVFEYLERRYNRIIRICGSVLSIITMMLYASFVTYGPALALSQVTGLSLWGSILTTTIIGSIYTSLGGIKAVIWTDAAQLIIFTIALLVAVIKGIFDIGGFQFIINKASEGNRLESLSFSFDPRVRFTFWSCFLGSSLRWTNAYGISQVQIQRYLACPTKKKAQKSLWLNYPGMIAVSTIYCFLGLMLYVRYKDCDPMISKQIQQADQIFPLFVMQIMQNLPGLPGLFVSGVYSASLSTISSQLNSLAAITLEDFVRPCCRNLSDEKATKISKVIALAYGALCLVVISGITNLGSIIQSTLYLVGGSNGANFGLFTLGLFIPWSNVKGTILGVCCGLSIGWWVSLGNQIHRPRLSTLSVSTEGCNETLGHWTPRQEAVRSDNVSEIYKISYLWIVPLSWFVTVLVGAVASRFIGTKLDTDQELFSPPIRYVMRRFGKNKKQPETENPSMNASLPPSYDDLVSIPILVKNEIPQFDLMNRNS